MSNFIVVPVDNFVDDSAVVVVDDDVIVFAGDKVLVFMLLLLVVVLSLLLNIRQCKTLKLCLEKTFYPTNLSTLDVIVKRFDSTVVTVMRGVNSSNLGIIGYFGWWAKIL